MLNNMDMAALVNRLVIPGAVEEILEAGKIDNDVRYALHEILSEQQPDTALLSIAISAQKIGAKYSGVHPALIILQYESVKLIEEYAELWLKNARKQPFDKAQARRALIQSPEDLEQISALLETASYFLQNCDVTAAELCRILMVQADAQSLIAESFAEAMLEAEKKKAESLTIAAENNLSHLDQYRHKNLFGGKADMAVNYPMFPPAAFSGSANNIISFPGTY